MCEYCLPLTKIGGIFLALKGSSFEEEINEAQNALKILGGKIENIDKVTIDEIEAERANIVIRKIASTPNKYPRGKNLPRVKPI